MTDRPIKRALISVSNKQGIVDFALKLHQAGVSLISTGGTCKLLRENGIDVEDVSDVTGFPEIMGGRVKTLHPKVHGGILGKRSEHQDIANEHGIDWIDLVIVNLYPFVETISRDNVTFEDAIENIDIGGPTMIRAAAKNMADVTVVIDPEDYQLVAEQITCQGHVALEQRKILAQKAFAHTARYDQAIAEYLKPEQDDIHIHLEKMEDLRYGENPHQKASAFHYPEGGDNLLDAKQHQGKALSYNNLVDAYAALSCVKEFDKPTCVIVKHANPCGIASDNDIFTAFKRAFAADDLSAFGGIIALNKPCDKNIAEEVAGIFFELIIAPGFSSEALELLSKKPNLRLLELPLSQEKSAINLQFLDGLVLSQEQDLHQLTTDDLKVVTQVKPSEEELNNLLFAWRAAKHVKSNAIVISKNNQTLGIGPGQVSRVDAVDIAIKKSGQDAHGAALASDAFFPFKDSIELIAKAGIKSIIQPGGSIRDEEVIQACDEHGIAMVFTGVRCFRH